MGKSQVSGDAGMEQVSANRQENERKVAVFSADFGNLDALREFVAAEAIAYGLAPAGVYAVQLAVDEGFTNIVEHAYGGESQNKIECTCQIAGEGLVVTLRDCGKPFNPLAVPEPNLEADLEDREIGGLGLYFIRQLMDEVTFSFIQGDEGQAGCNLLRMVKRKEQ